MTLLLARTGFRNGSLPGKKSLEFGANAAYASTAPAMGPGALKETA